MPIKIAITSYIPLLPTAVTDVGPAKTWLTMAAVHFVSNYQVHIEITHVYLFVIPASPWMIAS